ncbi:4Fe-4S binding protein [Thermococcus argininiproducens]|uniref:4Fe-4S binding protein n=1 Tax=Thermococcus argininiproducens TaxID=2866384 RepID=A0A9E7SD42_9EURY|nr:HgcAB-like fusion protein [Thermococcus argininiproducens]USH00147.1 4Fe-4S binding protein [Thermococcus argininiproducens]
MLRYIIVNIVGTLLRGFPMPCRTGLIKIGNPDEDSPVFLTANYCVTVERVKRVLEKSAIDCYLLVANSKGINVWCSAAGGYLTHHEVISALKTSGIEKLVKHRNVVLPQLAAAGVEARKVKEKTGWNIIWGPVYAKDIPGFIKNGYKKPPEMREVKFPLLHRIEMAVMWAFPFSIIVAFLAFFLWRSAVLPLFALTWLLPIMIFISFPLYSKFLNLRKNGIGVSRYTVIFDFGRVPLILEGVFIFLLIVYGFFTGHLSFEFLLRWGFVSFIIIMLVSIDLMGSTPVYKSGLHEERLLRVALDEEKCTGCGVCVQVCPRNCYEIERVAMMPRAERCVQCGACIVQCPFDALYFVSPEGRTIPPEVTRKFKLNLMGKRLVRI